MPGFLSEEGGFFPSLL